MSTSKELSITSFQLKLLKLLEDAVDKCTVEFTKALLEFKTINSSIGGVATQRPVHLGTFQGGVLTPLPWNLVINDLLGELSYEEFKVVGFVDDVLISISGFDVHTLTARLNLALSVLSKWNEVNDLGINPQKTELMLFTRKYKIPNFTPPN